MATVTTYCQRQDVIDRLSETGILYCADDDDDGALSAPDRALVDLCLASAGAEIDAALTPFLNTIPFSQDSGSLNQWLRDRAVDLASERVASRKGADVPEAINEAATRSRDWLEMVRKGDMRVPGLVYPEDSFEQEQRLSGVPRAVNPEPIRRGRRCG